MRPRAEILIDGRPVATAFYGALASLSVTDELGIESDTVEIVLDEARGEWEVPRSGAVIEVRMGFAETGLVRMGAFAKDGASGAGPVAELTILGTATDLGSTIRAPATRSWENVSLADIAKTLAAEARLRAVVAAELAETRYAFVAQRAESGLHLLTRLARPLDAVAKAADGRLVLAKLGARVDASGAELAPIRVTRSVLTGWTWSEETRGKYAAVLARWRNGPGGKDIEVVAGEGEPVKELRRVFASEEEARRAAASELDRLRRGDMRIDCEMGWRPDLFAGCRVELVGLRTGIDGAAQVTSVRHALTAGGPLVTSFSCQRSAGEPEP
jgi:phage protein D